MIRIIYYSLFITLLGVRIQAQEIKFMNESAFVTFSADGDDIYLDFYDDVTVGSTGNVVLKGRIYSDDFVLIKPNQNHTIVLKPMPRCHPCLGEMAQYDPPATVVKPKPGGPAKRYSPIVVLYPVPAQTIFSINVSNYLVEEYSILNQAGTVKLSENIAPTHDYTVDVSSLPNGNYILKLKLGDNIFFTKQFIKN